MWLVFRTVEGGRERREREIEGMERDRESG